jgi:membrane protease YdiL (CAAX protease family)/predicted RNA-binding Zn-ribbon protein involved in translation (DUF1610 family)
MADEGMQEPAEHYQAFKTNPPVRTGDESVTFACQECGENITLPSERCGHVESCPACGAFVDVPDGMESPPPTGDIVGASQSAAVKAESPTVLASDSRTAAQLWIEVVAVLCLAYFPYLFYALHTLCVYGPEPAHVPTVYLELSRIVIAFQTSMPLLVILSLAKDRWSLFGIVRPAWITDAVVGSFIGVTTVVAYRFVLSLLPPSMPGSAAILHTLHGELPQGLAAYVLILVTCLAGAFGEELVMRGYLIARLERLLGSTWRAVLITSVLFASYHLYQGVSPAVGHVATGLVYAVSFCLFRRLWPLCIAHALTNFMTYL